MHKTFNKVSFWIFVIFILLIQQVIYQPLIGDVIVNTADHSMFMYHWIIGSIWFKKNFLAIPWFSPAQCMSFPFYANPQNLYYSVSQIFFLIFSPMTALRVYFIFLSVISFSGMYLLLNKTFKFKILISLLGATLFLFNGYSIERFLSSHYGTVLFVYVPFYIFILSKTIEYNFRQIQFYSFIFISSIILSQIVYGGSAALTPHILLSTLVLVLIISIVKENKEIIFNYILSLIVFFLLSLSKINAGVQLLANFPRETHLAPFKVESMLYLLKNIVAGLFFYPLTIDNKLIPPNPGYLKDLPNLFVHELNYNVSVAPLLIFIFALFLLLKKIRLLNLKQIFKNNWQLKLLLLLILIFPVLINLQGLFPDLVRRLPIIKDLWINVRFFLIYLIPSIILCCLILNKLEFKYLNFVILGLVFVAILQSYSFPKKKYKDQSGRNYNDKELLRKIYDPNYKIENIVLIFHKKQKKDGTFAYGKLESGYSVPLIYQLANALTPYDCYEPILGYQKENQPKIKLVIDFDKKDDFDQNLTLFYSNPYWIDNGYYNFNNPICELFPDENSCNDLGEKFRVNEKNKLNQLLSFKPIEFKKSILQKSADFISLITVLSVFVYFIVLLIFYLRKKLIS